MEMGRGDRLTASPGQTQAKDSPLFPLPSSEETDPLTLETNPSPSGMYTALKSTSELSWCRPKRWDAAVPSLAPPPRGWDFHNSTSDVRAKEMGAMQPTSPPEAYGLGTGAAPSNGAAPACSLTMRRRSSTAGGGDLRAGQ